MPRNDRTTYFVRRGILHLRFRPYGRWLTQQLSWSVIGDWLDCYPTRSCHVTPAAARLIARYQTLRALLRAGAGAP